MMKQKLILIGNGMAGMRTIDELLKLAPEQYDITVFGAEPHGNYNRIMLSPVLAGDKTIDDIITHDAQWYLDNHISLHTNTTATEIDRVKRQVIADDGSVVPYDRLVLATGSKPFILPISGHTLEGVISFRDINDVYTMIETAQTH
jgi:nitrite reductase (NADH) large subunit